MHTKKSTNPPSETGPRVANRNLPPPTAWCFLCHNHVPLHRRGLWIRMDPHAPGGVFCNGSLDPILNLDTVFYLGA